MKEWISVALAARLMGDYDVDYFRRTFCAPVDPLLTIRRIPGPRGGRRILVHRPSLEALIQGQIQGPQPAFPCDPLRSPSCAPGGTQDAAAPLGEEEV
ncbi:hypothetical protein [Geothrix oryzisoli]|uniref:hypothetical protein n=1 Tax=Geothrix oryzisoli TaxID=2922721 RepID=UPI001FAE46C9|nr:hypothetical protein [Geothrix oryzisoli]